MKRRVEGHRPGYVTLLAITFAFGLAILGSALAVSSRSYIVSAAARERAILDRITLESVGAYTLAAIATQEQRPLYAVKLPSLRLNGREVEVEGSAPETKIDLGMDDEEVIRETIGLGASGALAQSADGLTAWAQWSALSTWQEDCLRRLATFGRAPEKMTLEPRPVEGRGDTLLAEGDQVDLRIALRKQADRTKVLWTRSRLSASPGQWRVHDYRLLVMDAAARCADAP